MSIHRLSIGAGYQYLLRHTATGDVQRAAGTPLTAYYTAGGYPHGRWLGGGLRGLTASHRASQLHPPRVRRPEGTGMVRLFGRGEHPVTGQPLGNRYRIYRPIAERVADRLSAEIGRLPGDLPDAERLSGLRAAIEAEERRRPTPAAVAGFDLTFTMPKSASVLWALAPAPVQQTITEAHRATVEEIIAVLERDAMFTRTGHGGLAQLATQGAVACCFDHWDTRAGDPIAASAPERAAPT